MTEKMNLYVLSQPPLLKSFNIELSKLADQDIKL